MMRNHGEPGTDVNVQDVGMALGMNRTQAVMATPQMWFLPSTVDPMAGSTVLIVEAVQRGLRKLGVRTRGDGYVDSATVDALRQLFGDRWKSVPWINICLGVLNAIKAGKRLCARRIDRGTSFLSMGADVTPRFTLTARGSARGTDAATTALFKDLQNQINRIAVATKAYDKIGADGIIGKNTVAGVKSANDAAGLGALAQRIGFRLPSGVVNPSVIARSADDIRDGLRQIADDLGAPVTVSPSRSRSRAGGGDGAVHVHADGSMSIKAAGFANFLDDPIMLAGAAATVGALYYINKQQKPKSKRRRKR